MTGLPAPASCLALKMEEYKVAKAAKYTGLHRARRIHLDQTQQESTQLTLRSIIRGFEIAWSSSRESSSEYLPSGCLSRQSGIFVSPGVVASTAVQDS